MAIAVKRRRDSPAYGQIHLLKLFLSWNIHPNNILLLKNVLYLTPEISFTTVLTIVGISLTAADLYFRWTTNKPKNNNQEYKPRINIEEHKPKINNDVVKPTIQPSKIPKRIGME